MIPDMERTAAWLAGNRAAGVGKATFDSQRLQVRQPRARPGRLDATSWPCSTGRWPRSAIRSWTWARRWPTGPRPTIPRRCTGSLSGPTNSARQPEPSRAGRALWPADRARHVQHALLLRLRPVQGRGDRAADLRPVCPGHDPGPAIRWIQQAWSRRSGWAPSGRSTPGGSEDLRGEGVRDEPNDRFDRERLPWSPAAAAESARRSPARLAEAGANVVIASRKKENLERPRPRARRLDRQGRADRVPSRAARPDRSPGRARPSRSSGRSISWSTTARPTWGRGLRSKSRTRCSTR